MVIGVEGNVHVGKTTYINNSFKDFNIIKEIEHKKDMSNFDRQLYYIEKEKEKSAIGNTILDRTILSTAIYSLNKFNGDKYNKLKNIIEYGLLNNEFIIPDYIYYIVYPYKLICNNHKLLYEKKGTQNVLVDYDYYLKYSIFFINSNSFEKIISTKDYRQIIVYNNNIFNNITKPIKIHNKSYNLDIIIEKINKLSNKEEKINLIDEIMKSTNLNDYITNIKCSNYKKIYKILGKNLGNMSNISLNTPLLLIDLFYEIKECIIRGEL